MENFNSDFVKGDSTAASDGLANAKEAPSSIHQEVPSMKVFFGCPGSPTGRTCLQYRKVLILLASVGALCVYAMRVNMNVAIVSMVDQSAVERTTRESNCNISSAILDPIATAENVTAPKQGQFSWSPKTQGIILGAFFWGYIITPIPGGFLAEKFGGKWLFGLGIVLTGILGMLIPIVTTTYGFLGLVGMRALQGFCEGVTYPALEAQLASWIPRSERSSAITYVHQGGYVGVIVGMLLSGKLAASEVLGGWPLIFYVFGAIAVVWFIFWALLTSDTPETHPFISDQEVKKIQNGRSQLDAEAERSPLPICSILCSLPVWAYVATTIGFLYLQYTLVTMLPTYLGTVLHYDIESNGLYSCLPYIGAIVTSTIAAKISDHWVKHNVLSVTMNRKIFNSIAMIGSSIVLMSVVALAQCDGQLTLILFLIAGAIRGVAESSTGPLAIDMAPQFAGTLFGITVTFGSFSGVIVPYVTGLLTNEENSTTNWSYSFYIAGCVGITSGILFMIFGSAEVQPWAVRGRSVEKSRQVGRDFDLDTIGKVYDASTM